LAKHGNVFIKESDMGKGPERTRGADGRWTKAKRTPLRIHCTKEDAEKKKEERLKKYIEKGMEEHPLLFERLTYKKLKKRGLVNWAVNRIQEQRKLQTVDRNRLPGWLWYMKRRPEYFKQMFNRDFSEVAAREEYQKINGGS
jgi:hypothetical protein